MNIFLISPVRDITEEDMDNVKEYVTKMEKEGNVVYWPIRDTDQTDPIGIGICASNARAMRSADEIHIWFSRTSLGSIFDLGMFFMLQQLRPNEKRFIFVNKESFPDDMKGKSFTKLMRYLDTSL